jgi:acetolactate synthase I/II/III large subunit
MLKTVFNSRICSVGNKLNMIKQLFHGMTGGQIVYKKLQEHNVNNVWISTGGAVMPLVDAFYKGNINYYLPSHEQSGGHCASGYAKVTGKPGISIVTSGPGFTNSLTALTDAMNDSVPFILFSGQVPLSSIGSQAFQECPSIEMSKPVTKWSTRVDDINKLPSIIDNAFKIALSGKPGAVHIDLPKCIISDKLTNKNYIKSNDKTDIKMDIIDFKTLKPIIELINKANKPVIIAGQGCNSSWNLLRQFSEIANIPATTTIHAMGCVDETSELSLEFLGMHGNAAANYSVQESDLIIAIGTRFDDRITGNVSKFAPEAFKAYKEKRGGIIHVNINNSEINYVLNSHYNFNTDAHIFLEKIIPYLDKKNNSEWINKINKWKRKYPFTYKKSNNMKTQQVIESINNYLLQKKINDYYISTGVGNHQMMASQFIKWKYPKSFLTSGSLGTMGVGLPYAIGAQIASPNSLVIDIDGDGSFNHSLHELKSIVDYNLPVKICIMNDNTLSMVKAWEQLFYDKRYTATDLKINPNYSQLAESFGIKGIKCTNANKLDKTIDYMMNYNGPILCDFKVEGDLCLPLVCPGKAIDDMILPDNIKTISNHIDNDSMPPG